MAGNNWHNLEIEQALQSLQTHRPGLSDEEASKRLSQYGENRLRSGKKASPLMLFLRQFLSPLIYVLLTAAVVSLATAHYIDAIVITIVLLLNAVIGFIQETRAEKAMEALLKMAAPKSRVRRGGKVKTVTTFEIVPGDIVLLETGDRIPADGRLVDVSNLRVNEAILTGESMPVEKHSHVQQGDIAIADRRNMVYMGTAVSYGRATAVITETAMDTQIGKIASAIQEIKQEKTPLQKSIDRISRYIIILILIILVLLVILGVLKGLSWLDTFLLAVAAAVSAIPEGLPAVVTVVLAVGMQIMAKRNAIIRKLAAVETLGSATVICSDKTGTLTLNEMTVRRIFIDKDMLEVSGDGYEPVGTFSINGKLIDVKNQPDLKLHLSIGLLCNDALLSCEKDFCEIFGDPTEGSLVVAAAKGGLDKEALESEFPRIEEIPFMSEKQYMATLHPGKEGGSVIYIKGSPEKILQYSSYVLVGGRKLALDESQRQKILDANNLLAGSAMRVIATAFKNASSETKELNEEDVKEGLVFVGLFGMEDPPRPEAKQAIGQCKRAGIKVAMITGDNKITAVSIAKQLDMPDGEAITGAELSGLSDEDLAGRIEKITVFARIEPLHKLRIVNALKAKGHVVAMTGDGVNDAPALKSANIGIAMGITGTDVAKEASDMVLADDNFASVVAAVDEGRAIFNRLRNVVFFLLSTNFGELLALLLSVAFIGQAPLLALQIIWVNLATDSACGIPLGLEPKHGNELLQPPRHPRVGLLYPGLIMRIIFMATLMGFGILLVFNWAQSRMSLEAARTLAFCTMVVFEWFRSFNARSDEETVFKVGILRNRWLLLTVFIAILMQIVVVYVPFMQVAFGTVPIGIELWGVAVLAGGCMFVIEELRKVFFPRLFSAGKWQPLSKAVRRRRS